MAGSQKTLDALRQVGKRFKQKPKAFGRGKIARPYHYTQHDENDGRGRTKGERDLSSLIHDPDAERVSSESMIPEDRALADGVLDLDIVGVGSPFPTTVNTSSKKKSTPTELTAEGRRRFSLLCGVADEMRRRGQATALIDIVRSAEATALSTFGVAPGTIKNFIYQDLKRHHKQRLTKGPEEKGER